VEVPVRIAAMIVAAWEAAEPDVGDGSITIDAEK
jgi:hypothetical protein